jgi:spermidine/putrescine-binding protein
MNRLLIALLLVLPAPGVQAQANELHLFNWNDYIAPETVERFQQA